MAQALDLSLQTVADTIRHVLNNYLSGLNPEPVVQCLEDMSEKYNNIKKMETDIDFGEEGTRIAYMYMYFMQHCFLVYRELCASQPYMEELFKSTEELKVCCIGGGPGTDLVALILFLQRKEMLPRSLHCTIVDKDNGWQATWEKIWQNFPDKPENFEIEVTYETCNLLDPDDLPEGVLNAVREAHIVTMITAYSHMLRVRRNPNLPRLGRILNAMESVMLFIDKDNKFKFEERFYTNHAQPAEMNRDRGPRNTTHYLYEYPATDPDRYTNINCFNDAMTKKSMSKCNVTTSIYKHNE